jgi:hypothetical protein
MVLAEAKRQSVQDLPNVKSESAGAVADFFYFAEYRPGLLDRRGSRNREKQLRNYHWHEQNAIGKGAFAGMGKRIASTPWELRGPDNLSGTGEKFWRSQIKALGVSQPVTNRPDIEYFQQLLRQAAWGRGWDNFVKGMVLDYLRQDGGAYVEVIGPGPAGKPLTGPPTMLANMDSLRVIPTGDPDFPAVYVDRKGVLHTMSAGRIWQLIDQPDTDETMPGYGECALSRAISIIMRDIRMTRYIDAFLDDKPAPGVASVSGMTAAHRDKAYAAFRSEQTRDEQPEWGKVVWLYGADPSIPLNISFTSFQQAPEKFDFAQYTEINVNAFALALNVDVQDIWQLGSGNLGSGQQSEILHQKSKGKALGDLYTQIERVLNDILPEEYEFTFKARDEQEDLHEAQVATQWTSAVATARNDLQDNEARQILANNVPGFHDAITDENGELIRVDDADVGAQEDMPDAVIAQQQLLQAAAQNGDAADEEDEEKALDAGLGGRQHVGLDARDKAFQVTRDNFVTNFADLIRAAIAGDSPDRRRFGIQARGLLRRHGLEAFRDGLEEGGVQDRELGDDDFDTFSTWLAEQSMFVTELSQRIYKEDASPDPERSAEMWGNKSLQRSFDLGLASADRNGLYEFVGTIDENSCRHCRLLDGQRHRLRDWIRTNWIAKSDRLECGGFNCKHSMVRIEGKARGRFPRG